MNSFLRHLGRGFFCLSLSLLLVTIFCFTFQPDRFAAFTVMPIWFWGGGGLVLAWVALYFFRVRFSFALMVVWSVTLGIGSDEARVLHHFWKSAPQPGAATADAGRPVMRVVSMNCAFFDHGSPAADIARWEPDILLLQDVLPHQVDEILKALPGGPYESRAFLSNAVITRWKIKREIQNLYQRDQQVTIALPNGQDVEVVNVHLATAATDLRLWKKSAWQAHAANRRFRKLELAVTQQILTVTSNFPVSPTLFGGDFNAPATDGVHRLISRDLVDSFAAVGTGWGNTFHRRFPILRIDYVYATRHFTPVRSRVVMSRHSDHRMVVSDFTTYDGVLGK